MLQYKIRGSVFYEISHSQIPVSWRGGMERHYNKFTLMKFINIKMKGQIPQMNETEKRTYFEDLFQIFALL